MAEEELKKGNQFEGKEEYIKDVFTEIADYYDEMNDIMSMGMVQGWHRFMMKKAGDVSGKRCLDVGTGTGEIAFHVARTAGAGSTVVGVDITPKMLEMAEKKEKEMDLPVKIDWRVGDALNLDFEDGSFDLVTSGYMLRNVTDILKAVSEMHRVLAPGGKVVVAELSKPKNAVVRFFYNIYMKRVKRYGRKYDKGKSIDGRQSAYQWLTTSIEGFPYGEDMVKIFKKAGFEDARFYVKSFGAVNIYVGSK
ncbi:MAG: bifunctional demethylmenaquinone methyltransferase/2-methoxy-6-polyprenyl-1,4-benzoquinol methylase UbiE [Candidatus Methanomethylophilaceae archaeon]|jgi:demethylmenaquinone methyltransferase/2-methoxy-6-polyprenyl-1,4-benzoquinol methylase|nr:bifunctional demethylmenaquinone methyltransferase/2-methoxy-6-polyprenyl-1,4-benzoquinol methylase UbiE [Candidatus Methanomethylophilaceae archaeon]MBR7006019.1 bifunctional demethylmenaquinone methyltransferase/2-methoxy-6-polyprenyl-1,4-benzoquinol methylase UbiE [Candidatus Methanomethylophilaceae archaeon]